ncbi:MAG: hypothetical protein H6739_36875 [Alphaproteobacteria bacterium]|nr:hypothetical protein [Alphaproteobacteria bacterium]
MFRNALLIALLGLASCAEARMERAVEAAATCDVDADCALVVAKCPYGCFVAVNVAEVDRIERRLDRAPSTCDYDCIEALGVFCDEGTCQVDYGE